MKPLKIAQIGTGHDHASAAWETLNANPEYFDVVGIAEPVDEYKNRLNENKAYKDAKVVDVERLLSMSDLDAVVVEAGKEYEITYAQLFADKGIPVYLDKPGSHDYEAYARFIDTMEKKSLPVGLGYMYRENPMVRKAFEMKERGELGEIMSVEGQMSVRHDRAKREWLSRYKGGMLYFLGCHMIDVVCMFKGFPERIIPLSASTGNEGVTSEDNGFAVFMYKDGASFVKANASEVNGYDRRQIVITGTKGTVEIRPCERYVEGGLSTTAKITTLKPGQNVWADTGEVIQSEPYNRYAPMLIRFAKAARGEGSMIFPYEYEKRLLETILKACGK